MTTTWTALLLADPSPCLRLLVLHDLLGRPADDAEVLELANQRATDPLVTELTARQNADGAWPPSADTVNDPVRVTAQALVRLGYLGHGPDDEPVRKGAEYLFSLQQADGSWPLNNEMGDDERGGRYTMIPLQTTFPLRGLAACGYASDPRAERAYDWLLAQRLEDGAWPAGAAGGNYGYIAGYRRLAHSRWGCRSNTTGALLCLAQHPQRRTEPETRRALDLLLGRETRQRRALGFEVARTIGVEPARGRFTYFARFDVALVLDLCWRVGASIDDERVGDLVAYVQEEQGEYGLWAYEAAPQVSRWVTFDLLRSLSRLTETDWLSLEPLNTLSTVQSENQAVLTWL